MAEPDYETIVSRQLAMNAQTWKLLLEQGVTLQTDVKLDFFFYAPNREAAEGLISLMKSETDYDLSPAQSAGPFWRKNKKWTISGSTQETKISPEILDQWVTWMVMAGKRSAGCVFDGWGTEAP